jgi:NAD(P)-dependent dehydrogenase (short-subunit alcohol dehydrogenase family)
MTLSDSEFASVRPHVALVTGASAGLGAAMVRALARNGWHVFAASRSAGSAAGSVGGRIEPLYMDVTQETSIHAALARVAERGLVFDLLINNAGINVTGVVEEMPREQGRAIIDTNLYGVVDTIRAVLPCMRERRRGTILTIGSLAALVAPPGEAYYAAGKCALEGFLESLQYEATSFGVRICLAEPGFVRTDFARRSVNIPATCVDYDNIRAALKQRWMAAIDAGMPVNDMADRIVNWAVNGRGFRKRFGLDALWAPIAKQLLPEAVFFWMARRKFGIREEGLWSESPSTLL